MPETVFVQYINRINWIPIYDKLWLYQWWNIFCWTSMNLIYFWLCDTELKVELQFTVTEC